MAFLRRHASSLAAILVILGLYCAARPPALSRTERQEIAQRFAFERRPLNESSFAASRSIRPVHTSLSHISAWVSAFGAAIAVNDLDGDGLPNDLCHIETRTDEVILLSAPGTPARYPSFSLDPAPLVVEAGSMAPTGCMMGDFNEDGLADILVYYWGRTPILFLRRSESAGAPPSNAVYRRSELVSAPSRWFTSAASAADLDNDGHVDLVFGNYFPDDARVLEPGDGMMQQMPDSLSRARNGGRNRLFRWRSATAGAEPHVDFEDVPTAFDDDSALGWTLALGAADLDGDMKPELYVSNDFGPDVLLHNRSEPGRVRLVALTGARGLTSPRSQIVGRDTFKSMGIDFADLNNDGLLDMFVSNITSDFAFRESNFAFVSTGEPQQMQSGIAPFTDRGDALGLARGGWGWDTRFADFDNDGTVEAILATGFVRGTISRWPELQELGLTNEIFVHEPRVWFNAQPGDDIAGGEHNLFYVRAADDRFYDMASELGMDQAQVTRGIATADIDDDGDLDMMVANQWESSYVYINNSPVRNRFLGLNLRLPTRGVRLDSTTTVAGRKGGAVGRAAIGAQAVVSLPGRKLLGQVDGGNGHSGDRSPDLHFGLGDHPADRPLSVELSWRDSCGTVRHERLMLAPGWHTVMLASPQCAAEIEGALP